ncbi:MAG: hypothetical protein WCF99_03375 [Chloroflexales bacterium]
MSLLTRAYVRRKRFEARLIAQEVGTLLGDPDANPASPTPDPARVAPHALLKTMGIELI